MQDREEADDLHKEAEAPTKGAGISVHIKVDDIADYHEAVVAQWLQAGVFQKK